MKALALPMFLLMACAGNPALDVSVQATNTASHVVQALDQQIAPLYKNAAAAALEGLPDSATYQDYQDAMARWDALETGLSRAHVGLLAAQDALKAWASGAQSAEGDYRAALACVAEGLSAMANAAPKLGLKLPPELYNFLALAAPIVGTCHDA